MSKLSFLSSFTQKGNIFLEFLLFTTNKYIHRGIEIRTSNNLLFLNLTQNHNTSAVPKAMSTSIVYKKWKKRRKKLIEFRLLMTFSVHRKKPFKKFD